MKSLARVRRLALVVFATLVCAAGVARAETGTFDIFGYDEIHNVHLIGEGYWEGDVVPDGQGGYTIEGEWYGGGTVIEYSLPWTGFGDYIGAGPDIEDITVDAAGVWTATIWINGVYGPFYAEGTYESLRVSD